MHLVFCDFETRYSTRDGYTLSKMTPQAYIHDERFTCFGVGLAIDQNPAVWITNQEKQKNWLSKVIPGNVVVGHNISGFDAPILNWVFDLKPKLIIDTLALSRALIGEKLRSHSLDSVAKFLGFGGKLPYLKEFDGIENPTPEQLDTLGLYCALHPTQSDIALTRGIFYKLYPHFPKKELRVVDLVARMYSEPALLLDRVLLQRYHSEVVAKKARLLDDAGVESATELNSNPQFAEALKRFGVVPPTKISPATGNETFAFAKTDEGLVALQSHPDERVQALVAARLGARSTLAETRAQTLMDAHRYGPYPISYNYSGAMTTHRLSGSGGSNMQNLPRGGALRKAILAPIRHTLIVGDLSQVELRVTLGLAVQLFIQSSGVYNALTEDGPVCEESKALKLLASGEDLYSYFGSIIYNTPVSRDTHPLERQIAKSAVLGLGFGMGKDKFVMYCKQQNIDMDDQTAGRVVKLYRTMYRGVCNLWRYMEQEVKKFLSDPELKSVQLFKEPDVWVGREPLFGDPCVYLQGHLAVKYPGLRWSEEDKSLMYDRALGPAKMFAGKFVENLVQYLARNIIMDQTVQVSTRYKVAMSTHDELVAVVPRNGQDDETAAILEGKQWIQSIMETSPKWWPSLPLNAELKSADRYGDCK